MLLEVKDLSFSYRGSGRWIFRGVNLSLAAGEVLTILGPNGAGKSTLLNCLANLLTPNDGAILINGCPLSKMRLRDAARVIGFVPQNHTAMYAYTVRDFVVMGRAPHLGMLRRPSAADYALADAVMGELNILHYADKPYTRISGGERQQALIARALVQEPKIVMFDEPTNHLDFGNQLRTVNKIGELTKRGYAVVMTTHMPDHAIRLGGVAAILNRKGELLCGSADEVITEENLCELYQTDIRIVYVPEAGYRICVFAKDPDRRGSGRRLPLVDNSFPLGGSKMNEIHVLEKGVDFSYSFDEMLKYHGTEYPGGVAHAFKVMERAFPLLSDGMPLERREISLVTAFGGPGGRDAFEMVTRCVTDGRFSVDKNLPEAMSALESPGGRYYFRFSYRGRSVEITIRPGHVREEFIRLARKKDRTSEEEEELAAMKREMADRLMASKAEEVYDAKIL